MDAGEMFVKYDYAETKDLLKTFITLISATLVLSLTFSEKVIGFSQAATLTKRILVSAWAMFLLALIIAGLALCLIAGAAGKALYGNIPFFNYDVGRLAVGSWACVLTAGCVYVAGLAALAISASLAIGSPQPSAAKKPPDAS